MDPYKPDIFESIKDPYSYAEPELARVTDTRLELNVDFDQKILEGKAILTIKKKNIPEKEETIFLDNYNLDIIKVIDYITGLPLRYRYGYDNDHWGSLLMIQLPQTGHYCNECKIEIEYRTSEDSNALVWLSPEQTADGKHPFLVSNNKYTYARAMFPCQDTPSVKSTYSAEITVPSNYRVIMSAVLQNVSETQGQATYEFVQWTPIPAYGVVIAVGSLQEARVGSMSVFAESTYINDSSTTFANVESLMQIACELCGFYTWNKCNICVLPPTISPKYFTIEGPNVIFVPQSLLGRGIFLDSFLARKIAHMWPEYLVTSVNYDHMWLNKSFGIFIYKKIINRMQIDEKTKEFLKVKVDRKLVKTIERFKDIGIRLQSLIPRLDQNILPNYAMECVPYEVGCMILEQLERKLGGPSVFEQYLKFYFSYFVNKSINSKDWRKHFIQYFARKELEVLKSLDWNVYFFNIEPLGPFRGISNTVSKRTTLETECSDLAKMINWNENVKCLPDVKLFSDIQKKNFLKCLYKSTVDVDLFATKMNVMSNEFHAQSYKIQFRWILLCIKNRWVPIIKTALNFAIKCGVPNYAHRIFRDLYNWEEIRLLVIHTYIRNKERMLLETQVDIESRILGFNE